MGCKLFRRNHQPLSSRHCGQQLGFAWFLGINIPKYPSSMVEPPTPTTTTTTTTTTRYPIYTNIHKRLDNVCEKNTVRPRFLTVPPDVPSAAESHRTCLRLFGCRLKILPKKPQGHRARNMGNEWGNIPNQKGIIRMGNAIFATNRDCFVLLAFYMILPMAVLYLKIPQTMAVKKMERTPGSSATLHP